MTEKNKWQVVCVASGMTNAHLVEGRLKTEGINTHLIYETVGILYATNLDGLGEVKILVPEEELEKARMVLAQSYEDDDLQ
ncbi:Putative signal transducing protein [Syntrophus gentianae]|uniref:Putative signal transducing protein n=2 Tax=Syntrophus gentianae TaxID=43775 RepID=A0A1H7X3I9_9BACT|nr:Putative signal transducing protein [Syntrophus gentianae]